MGFPSDLVSFSNQTKSPSKRHEEIPVTFLQGNDLFYLFITYRFQSTIKAQFYGHTHFDQLKLFYSPNPSELGVVINSLFITPSLTAYQRFNPAYKIFYADAHFQSDQDKDDEVLLHDEENFLKPTFEILDYQLDIFNLEEANKRPTEKLNWFPLYRATTDYGLTDTRNENLPLFIDKMARNKTLFDLYYQ